jgi:GMP synthase-like glutamine amidotransferase
MKTLILKNDYNEGPKTIATYLDEMNIHYDIISLHKGESIPDTSEYETLVIMGGHMSANDLHIPYIKDEIELAKIFMEQDKKVLGVCLGAQIMAKALGAKVYKGTQKEIGWYDIVLTPEGIADPLMNRLKFFPDKNIAKVIQWHGETFDLPIGAVRLASSELYANQAFKYVNNAYAFQFHIEVTGRTVIEWLEREKEIDLNKIEKETEEIYDEYLKRAYSFYDEFFM